MSAYSERLREWHSKLNHLVWDLCRRASINQSLQGFTYCADQLSPIVLELEAALAEVPAPSGDGKPEPDSREWWMEVAQGLAIKLFDKNRAREAAMLKDVDLMQTTDHVVWAKEFVKRYGGDEELMASWFASAMMAKHDAMCGPPNGDALQYKLDRAAAPQPEGERQFVKLGDSCKYCNKPGWSEPYYSDGAGGTFWHINDAKEITMPCGILWMR
jgi:hypothetical protein